MHRGSVVWLVIRHVVRRSRSTTLDRIAFSYIALVIAVYYLTHCEWFQ